MLFEADIEEVCSILRNKREDSRIYADFWGFSGNNQELRKASELEVARQLIFHLASQRKVSFSSLARIPTSEDGYEPFPDIEVRAQNTNDIGIEITELVSQEKVSDTMKSKNKNLPIYMYDWEEYDSGKLQSKLNNLIIKKNTKINRSSKKFDQLWLAICTDEPLLCFRKTSALLENIKLQNNNFNQIYLVFSYDPACNTKVFPEGYPVIKLK